MATYTVTTSNWNSPAFWSGVSEGAGGHELDFSGLGSDYTVEHDVFSGQIEPPRDYRRVFSQRFMPRSVAGSSLGCVSPLLLVA